MSSHAGIRVIALVSVLTVSASFAADGPPAWAYGFPQPGALAASAGGGGSGGTAGPCERPERRARRTGAPHHPPEPPRRQQPGVHPDADPRRLRSRGLVSGRPP